MFKIADKEIRDALNSRLFMMITGLLLLLTAVSVVMGSFQVRASVIFYNQSIEFLKSAGKTEFPPMPQLNPIASSKNFVNYLGMIGALLSIVLGNRALVREKKAGTLRLILSRPVYRDTFLNGKLLGNLTILAGIAVLAGTVTFLSLLIIGGVPLHFDDIARMLWFFVLAFLYMAFFLVLSLFTTLIIRDGNRAILAVTVFWLILSFVLPQIGDTMDMDNQIPGGFFASMGLSKDQEKQVLLKFKFYETLRDSLEEMSPLKHYERAGFALLNVKPGFEADTALKILGLKWVDLIGLTVPSILLCLFSYMVFLRKEDVY